MEIVGKPQKLVEAKHIEVYEKCSTVRWPIKRFIADAYYIRTKLDSEHFSLNGLSSTFFLRVYTSCLWNGRLYYFFHVSDIGSENEVEFTVRFWLGNVDGEKCAETELKTAKVTRNGQYIGYFDKVLTREQILSKADFFKFDKAIVCCEVSYKVSREIVDPPNSDTDFRKKLWNSRAKGFHDTVTIKVEGKELKISKEVLTANSDVFERMFLTSNCIETKSNVIEIEDIKLIVMEVLIKYMYLGKLDDIGSIAIDLFKAADKYKIKGLKELCAESIGKSLSGDTLFDIVTLAYTYKCDFLKAYIFEFLVTNLKVGHFAELISSGQWIKFAHENEELAGEIIKDILGNMKFTC